MLNELCKSVKEVLTYTFKSMRNAIWQIWGTFTLGVDRDPANTKQLFPRQRWTVGLLLWLTGHSESIGYSGNNCAPLLMPAPLKLTSTDAQCITICCKDSTLKILVVPPAINVPKQDIQWAEANSSGWGRRKW